MSQPFAGARWWKFDFHTHTPESTDTGWHNLRGGPDALTPERWLQKYMEAGIDCVAVTDHNGGGWIDPLKAAYRRLDEAEPRPAWFRKLTLFPGVEISVNGGVHLLAIFDPAADTAAVNDLLSRAGYTGDRGDARARTDRSLMDVIEAATKCGALVIPAHVDAEKGLLQARADEPTKPAQDAGTVEAALASPYLFAGERLDMTRSLPRCFETPCSRWTWVLGSDCHNFRPPTRLPGSYYTWVKMGQPTLEGLRLALLDGNPLSVLRSDEQTDDPNAHARLTIERIEVRDAKYAGRGRPLVLAFSPWLSTLIGGRGAGKSTAIELLRLAFRRETDLPRELAGSNDFFKVAGARGDRGGLMPQTHVCVTLATDGHRFRVHWRQDGTGPAIEVERADGTWNPEPGDVRSRFPVRVFSQKEIFALARDPGALLARVDESADVRRADWEQELEGVKAKFLRLRAQRREVETRLAGRSRIEGELADVRRKLAVFESGENREVLQRYQKLRRQRRAFEDRAKELVTGANALRAAGELLLPSDVPAGEFDGNDPLDAGALASLNAAAQRQRELAAEVETTAAAAAQHADAWAAGWRSSGWSTAAAENDARYAELVTALAAAGVQDAAGYGTLVQRRQLLEKNLEELEAARVSAAELEQAAAAELDRAIALRRELTQRRVAFLSRALANNDYVRMRVVPFGHDPKNAEESFRERIGKDGEEFRNAILTEDQQGGLLGELYAGLPDGSPAREEAFTHRLHTLNDRLAEARKTGTFENGFKPLAKHLAKLRDEQMDHLALWWPEDGLQVDYRRGPQDDWRSIEQGSPGQKSAAILAFALSFGDEPILLDQPEDDLDNHLIYDLVVRQIRTMKRRRQVIIATHNPNIVVNGDAEMVIAMEERNGHSHIIATGTGCLQDNSVREEVCQVMEGGREAFERRYQRIAGGR